MNRPTTQLIDWANLEFGVLLHFDIEVFDPAWMHISSGKLNPPPDVRLFNPQQLDTDQWLRAVKAAGATYAVLTAKHVTGFTLFPDPEYDYAIDKTPFQEGKGDIVKAFIQSCHKFGIKPGLYYSCEANSYLHIHKSSGNMPTYPSPEWDDFTRLVSRHLQHLWSQSPLHSLGWQ
nr:alpha-L-fucosidase [Candidatus Sigynarchaeota archaeon]